MEVTSNLSLHIIDELWLRMDLTARPANSTEVTAESPPPSPISDLARSLPFDLIAYGKCLLALADHCSL
jgi:hypothetical protein